MPLCEEGLRNGAAADPTRQGLMGRPGTTPGAGGTASQSRRHRTGRGARRRGCTPGGEQRGRAEVERPGLSWPSERNASENTQPLWRLRLSPKLSPDGTTIAFLRDPYDPHIKHAAPYVLQVWLINVDGSGLRKVGQQPGCCITIAGKLHWSKDGSSIVLVGIHKQRIDVAPAEGGSSR